MNSRHLQPLRSTTIGALALLAFGVPAMAQEPTQITWPRKQYDPSPVDGDRDSELVLPMPCGGAMVFRRVATAGNGWQGERPIEIGSRDRFDAPVDQLRAVHVAGAFDSGTADAHYYLGKYEVTELQLRVVNEACPERLRGRRPAVSISWFDALAFSQRYTEWLMANARGQLPVADGAHGFLRLPTEVEWEYAARGGRQVDEDAFRLAVYPLGQHPLKAHAWYRESVSPNFKARPIGLLQPNPLGLHDMLGNAAELVFDLFHLSAGGRLRAQAGGFMVKGGHFRTPQSKLSTSMRQEHPHFNGSTGLQTRLDTVGFRLAISAPVLTSLRRLQDIQRDWSMRPRRADAGAAQCGPASAPQSVEQRFAHCKVATGQTPLPDFPRFAPSAVTELPPWETLLAQLNAFPGAEIHEFALAYLQARDADRALLLFREAARRGDGRAALAVGAMYDPRLFDTDADGRTPFSKPNPELARCWYQVAWRLGEVRAWSRVKGLTEGEDASSSAEPDLSTTPPGCEQLVQQYARQ